MALDQIKHIDVSISAPENVDEKIIQSLENVVLRGLLDSSSAMKGELKTLFVYQESVDALARFQDLIITPEERAYIREYLLKSENAEVVNLLLALDYQSSFRDYSLIPSEYQLVDYIEGDGESFIKTKYRYTAATIPNIKMVCLGSTIQEGRLSYLWGFGVNLDDYSSAGYGEVKSGLYYKYDYKSINYRIPFTTKVTITLFSTTTIYVNGLSMLNTGAMYGGGGYLCLLNICNNDGTDYNVANTKGLAKIFSFQTLDKEDKHVIMNLVPCYRVEDNEPGMYDTVSGDFYTNAGSGTFSIGNKFFYPSKYTERDILKAIGDFVAQNDLTLTDFKSLTYNILDSMVHIGKLDLQGCANIKTLLDMSNMTDLVQLNLISTEASVKILANSAKTMDYIKLGKPLSIELKNITATTISSVDSRNITDASIDSCSDNISNFELGLLTGLEILNEDVEQMIYDNQWTEYGLPTRNSLSTVKNLTFTTAGFENDIKHFTGVENLVINCNSSTALDLSNNSKLKTVDLQSSNIVDQEFKDLPNLTEIKLGSPESLVIKDCDLISFDLIDLEIGLGGNSIYIHEPYYINYINITSDDQQVLKFINILSTLPYDDFKEAGYIRDGMIVYFDVNDMSDDGTILNRLDKKIICTTSDNPPSKGSNYIEYDGTQANKLYVRKRVSTLEEYNPISLEIVYFNDENELDYSIIDGYNLWDKYYSLRVHYTWYRYDISQFCGNKCIYRTASGNKLYINNIKYNSSGTLSSETRSMSIGRQFIGKLYCIRAYNRELTESEILHNQQIDNQRFNLGL